MTKYIDADLLRKEIERLNNLNKQIAKEQGSTDFIKGITAGYAEVLSSIDSLQQELDSRSIPVLRADTTEKQDRILEIIGQDEIYCHFSLDFGKETDCGYEDYNDRIYIDGHLTFNKMAEIVDFLSKNSK